MIYAILTLIASAFLLYLQDRRHAADRAAFASERKNLLDLIAYKEHLPSISEGIPKPTARGMGTPVSLLVPKGEDLITRLQREQEEAEAKAARDGFEVMN